MRQAKRVEAFAPNWNARSTATLLKRPNTWANIRQSDRPVALHSLFMTSQPAAATALVCALALGCAFGRDPVRAKHAMVVAQEPNATDVGVAVLKAGGNAVDAAVAVGFAL